MPTYEYECPKGHRAEDFRPANERDDAMPCVKCNEQDGSVVEMKRVPVAASGRVLGGTPTFYPGRTHK